MAATFRQHPSVSSAAVLGLLLLASCSQHAHAVICDRQLYTTTALWPTDEAALSDFAILDAAASADPDNVPRRKSDIVFELSAWMHQDPSEQGYYDSSVGFMTLSDDTWQVAARSGNVGWPRGSSSSRRLKQLGAGRFLPSLFGVLPVQERIVGGVDAGANRYLSTAQITITQLTIIANWLQQVCSRQPFLC